MWQYAHERFLGRVGEVIVVGEGCLDPGLVIFEAKVGCRDASFDSVDVIVREGDRSDEVHETMKALLYAAGEGLWASSIAKRGHVTRARSRDSLLGGGYSIREGSGLSPSNEAATERTTS